MRPSFANFSTTSKSPLSMDKVVNFDNSSRADALRLGVYLEYCPNDVGVNAALGCMKIAESIIGRIRIMVSFDQENGIVIYK